MSTEDDLRSEGERPEDVGPRTRFGLRTKLALGFGGLVLLLLLLGAQSISLLDRLSGSIDVTLRENYVSVLACQEMKEALERMDSGALFALAGVPERGRVLAAVHRPRFEAALDRELHNITVPGEQERACRLRDLYSRYRATLPEVLASAATDEARTRIYFDRLLPVFTQIKTTADEILKLNQTNMIDAKERARAVALRATREMILLLLAGIVAAALLVAFLSRSILGPLGRLTASAREIERGNLDLTVPVTSGDELGHLAQAFNEMAARLRELRRSDQAKLLRAQQISQRAIDSLPDAVALFSPSGEVELANRTAIATFSLRPGEPIPERHASWLGPLLSKAARPTGKSQEPPPPAGLAGGTEGAIQLFKEGQERFFLPQAFPIRDVESQVQGVTLVLADVTELRRADEMKSGLLSTVSHELRTPLTSLQMAIHVLLDEGLANKNPLDAQQTELLLAAREDASRLREIVESLLELSRLESGEKLLRLEPKPSREFVEATANEFRPDFEDHGIALAVEIDPDAPKVLVDPVRGRLVLANLLSNALHHTPAGGKVTVRAAPHGGYVRISVADTGRGIPPEHVDRIFDRFYQVPDTEDLGGAGLGLSIARQIVHAHGGEIHAQSRASEGATFWFSLPAARA